MENHANYITLSIEEETKLSALYESYGVYDSKTSGFDRKGHAEQICEILDKPAIYDLILEITKDGSRYFIGAFHNGKLPKGVKTKNCINTRYLYLTLFMNVQNTFKKFATCWLGIAKDGSIDADFDYMTDFSKYNIKFDPVEQFEGFVKESEFYDRVINGMFNAYITINLAMFDSISKKYISNERKFKHNILNELNTKTYPKKVVVTKIKLNEFVEEKEKQVKSITEKSEKMWHCEAWGVRGHYRHCRNGKTVYVKPYVKGAKKENFKGREYVFN